MADILRRRERVASLAYPEHLLYKAMLEADKLGEDCRVKTALWHMHQAREQLGDFFDGVDHAERAKAVIRAESVAAIRNKPNGS
jgi:hypothetical protein